MHGDRATHRHTTFPEKYGADTVTADTRSRRLHGIVIIFFCSESGSLIFNPVYISIEAVAVSTSQHVIREGQNHGILDTMDEVSVQRIIKRVKIPSQTC